MKSDVAVSDMPKGERPQVAKKTSDDNHLVFKKVKNKLQ